MPENRLFQVAYMPYAPIEERLQIGNYEVWPYYREATSRIENKDVIERLNHLFSCYNERKFEKEKGGYDKPLDEIFIVSPVRPEAGIGTLTEDQRDQVRSISHIMAYRLLSLVMCFEVLLNFGGTKTKFADKIETRIDNYRPQMEPRTVRNSNRDADVTHSKTAWWAYDLYDLRSAIIHGKRVNWDLEKYGDIWTRIEFGGVLLRKLVKKALSEERLWPPDSDGGARADAILEADALDNLLARKVTDFRERRRS